MAHQSSPTNISISSLMLLMMIFSISCTYDNAEELYGTRECEPDEISFSEDIMPIIATNCAIAGCHVSGQQRPTLENYGQISANAERVEFRTSNGTMPPSTSGLRLSQDEINAISCWVDAGAPEN